MRFELTLPSSTVYNQKEQNITFDSSKIKIYRLYHKFLFKVYNSCITIVFEKNLSDEWIWLKATFSVYLANANDTFLRQLQNSIFESNRPIFFQCNSAGYTRCIGSLICAYSVKNLAWLSAWLSFPSQCLCGTILPTLHLMPFETRVFKIGSNAFLLASTARSFFVFYSFPFVFFLCIGWYSGVLGLRTDRVSIVFSRPCIAYIF